MLCCTTENLVLPGSPGPSWRSQEYFRQVQSSYHAHEATKNQVPVQVPDATSNLTSKCRFKTPDPVFMNSGLHPDQNLKFDLEDALNRAKIISPIMGRSQLGKTTASVSSYWALLHHYRGLGRAVGRSQIQGDFNLV